MKLEAVVIPVADVERAKRFYGNLGWRLDADFPFENGFRVGATSSSRAARISETIRYWPWAEPGAAEVMFVPNWIEHPEPGGVNCTRINLLLEIDTNGPHDDDDDDER